MINHLERLCRTLTKRELIMQGSMLSGEIAQTSAKFIANDEQLDPESPLGHIVYNGGDFVNTYTIATMADIFMRTYTPNLPEKKRRNISSAISTAALLVAEIAKLPNHMLGTPDIKDIPAGLLGIGFYHLVNRAISKNPYYDAMIKD